MGNLFAEQARRPLAERLRPRTLKEFVGQEKLVGPGRALRKLIESGELRSLILWGPPGTGKTTLGWIIANRIKGNFLAFSAAVSGIKEIRRAMEESRKRFRSYGSRDVIFIDEIHRFNKAQQDVFLPFLEEGCVVLVGATTENPSLELVTPLLSRSQVFVLEPLSAEEIQKILKNALEDEERGLGGAELAPEAAEFIAQVCDGDARRALNILELAADLAPEKKIGLAHVQEAAQRKLARFDKQGEEFYNLISALHKSVRNSDPDAALYWLARMLAGGADPLYIARRLIRMATEDIGLADPRALQVTVSAKAAFEALGPPEGELALAEATVYLATAPKSNSVYRAYDAALEDVEKTRNEPVPLHLRNPVTKLMKETGYGEGYQYAHDVEGGVAKMECLPENLKGRRYYRPKDSGYEAEVAAR
ncbi:MAG: replication-associated recombination protein A, partial [Candidatus Bipolaricaulia bacterium]